MELVAPLEVRLQRNGTENRLRNKPSTRNVELSNQRVIEEERDFRMESLPGEVKFDNYLRVDNSNLTAEEAAKLIQEHFGL